MRGLGRRSRRHAGQRALVCALACCLLAATCSYDPRYEQSLCASQAPLCPAGYTCDGTSNRCVKGNDASVLGPGGASGGATVPAGTGGSGGDAGRSGPGGSPGISGAPGGAGDSGGGAGTIAGTGATGGGASGGSPGNGGAGGACATVCTPGAHSCTAGNLLRTCALSNGCPAWDAGHACGDHATCTASGGDASCACASAPAQCQGAVGSYCDADGMTLETCLSDNGCLYLQSPATTCPTTKPCTVSAGKASCSCPPEPAACMGVTGPTCAGAAQYVTCSRDANQCLVVSTPVTACGGAAQCTGQPGTATCSCPAAPPQCQSFASGTVCSGNDVYSCTVDGSGCVTATKAATCTTGKPCGASGSNAACMCANPASATDCPSGQMTGARCSGNTLVNCTTNSDGCVSVSTTMCAGSCAHAYPSATCVSEQSFGWPTDAGGSENSSTGYLAGVPVTPTSASTLLRFGIVSHAAGASVVMALYSSDGSGNPSARLAYIGSATLVTGVNEFAATPAGVTLAANSTYWIMVATSAAVTVGGGAAGQVQLDYISYTFGSPIPASWPAVGSFSTAPINPPPTYYIVALPQ